MHPGSPQPEFNHPESPDPTLAPNPMLSIRRSRMGRPHSSKFTEEQRMFRTILRRDFLTYALASAVVTPALSRAAARATDLTPLDPTDSTAQALGFVPDGSKVAANANPTFKSGQHCGVCAQ